MSLNLLLDYNILGWAEKRKDQFLKTYGRILRVGTDIPRRNKDIHIAAMCKEENCDLLTSDAKAYTHYFSAGIELVQITKFGWDEKNEAPVYLVRILERNCFLKAHFE